MKAQVITKKWVESFFTKTLEKTLKKALTAQDQRLDQKLAEQNQRFDQKLATQDQRFTQKLESRLLEQDERFAQRLIKHFYTKDEIDRKFANFYTKPEIDERFATKEDLKKAIDEGVDRIKVLFEANLSKIQIIAEGHGFLKSKLENHEERIGKLESI